MSDPEKPPAEPSVLPGGGAPVGVEEQPLEGRFDLGGRSLREHTARGTMINSAFHVGLTTLGLLRNVAIAAFLTASEFGVWGLIVTTLMTLAWLKQVGISDKFVQQDEPDQVRAFQKAFTLELGYSGLFFFLLVGALPFYAEIYGRPEIIVPGLVLALVLPIGALRTPLWIPYRQMRFFRQRVLEAIDPVVSTFAVFALAIAGAGYWALVIGLLAGAVAAAVVAVATCPYPLALRYDRGTLSEYFGFSWPLFAAGASGLVGVQGTMIIGSRSLGLAALGAIGLAGQLARYGDQVNAIISRTLYPAVCAVKDRVELLHETFVKSNRVALMWAMPFGVGLFFFAPDLTDFVLGETWRPAGPLLQAFGLILAFRQVGFNWMLFFIARGNTRPVAVDAGAGVVVFALATAPLMIAFGLTGYVIGSAMAVIVQLSVRARYLARLFEGFSFAAHLARAVAPTIVAAAAVLAVRALPLGERSPGLAIAELALYLAATAVATVAFERSLLGELVGYLRGGLSGPHAAGDPGDPNVPVAVQRT